MRGLGNELSVFFNGSLHVKCALALAATFTSLCFIETLVLQVVHSFLCRPPWLGFSQQITPSVGPDVAFPCIWQNIKHQDDTVRTASFTNWDW